jgi:hypothetical protein
MYYREYLLSGCSYLIGESEKQTHLCRTIGLLDYWVVGLTGCQIIATLPYSITFNKMSTDNLSLYKHYNETYKPCSYPLHLEVTSFRP